MNFVEDWLEVIMTLAVAIPGFVAVLIFWHRLGFF